MQPSWQSIHDDFKHELVQYLDLSSRLNLSLCSKKDQILVRNSLLVISCLQFSGFRNMRITLYVTELDEESPQFLKYKGYWYCIETMEVIIEKLMSLIKYFHKLRIESLEVETGSREDTEYFIEQLRLDPEFHLNVANFHCTMSQQVVEEYLLLLNTMKSASLQAISIDFCHNLNALEFLQVVHTEQWKRAELLHISHVWNTDDDVATFPVESFFTANKIYIDFTNACSNYTANDYWKVIKHFRSKQLPIGAYFKIKNNDDVVDELLKMFDEKWQTESVSHQDEIARIRLLNLDNGTVLIVRLLDGEVTGQIVPRGKEEWTDAHGFQMKYNQLKRNPDSNN